MDLWYFEFFNGLLKSSKGERETYYFKIWNPDHIRKDTIPRAVEAGFYGEQLTPALHGIIYHQGICRGYVMRECALTGHIDLDFYVNLKRKTVVDEFFAIQFSRFHTGVYEGRTSLIDLESVHPLYELPLMPDSQAFFDDPDYEDYVISCYKKKFSKENVDRYMINRQRPIMYSHLMSQKKSNFIINILYEYAFKFHRQIKSNYGKVFDHRDLIEF
jgi:hypothetical protein